MPSAICDHTSTGSEVSETYLDSQPQTLKRLDRNHLSEILTPSTGIPADTETSTDIAALERS